MGLKPKLLRKERQFAVFFDYVLVTDTPIDENVVTSLITTITTKTNDYAHCACGEQETEVTGVVELGNNGSRRKMKSSYRTRKNLAMTGRYRPPPNMDPTGLVKESLGKGGRGRRFLQTYDSSCNTLDDDTMTEKLNEQEVFNGTVHEAYVELDSVSTCYTDAGKCCEHISDTLTSCNAGEHDPNSLCQLDCCCSHPEEFCCQRIAKERCGSIDAMCNVVEDYEPMPPTPVPKNIPIDIIIP